MFSRKSGEAASFISSSGVFVPNSFFVILNLFQDNGRRRCVILKQVQDDENAATKNVATKNAATKNVATKRAATKNAATKKGGPFLGRPFCPWQGS
jgi:hypothetical protein